MSAPLDPNGFVIRRGRRRIWTMAAIVVPLMIILLTNIIVLEARRRTFLSVCTKQAGVFQYNTLRGWERVTKPDCTLARNHWQCKLDYQGPPLRVSQDLLPFRFSDRDDFGALSLSPVPRVAYARTPSGHLFRISNFAFANLKQWDVLVPVYPTQNLCFPPLSA